MERSPSPIQTKAHCKEIPWWSNGWVSTFPLQMAQVQSLVGEIRSCKPCGLAKKNKQCTLKITVNRWVNIPGFLMHLLKYMYNTVQR